MAPTFSSSARPVSATSEPGPHFVDFKATRRPPRCTCGGVLKSATISFGQSLRATDLERAAAAARSEADLVLALGSTLSVYPAASIPLMAAERGALCHRQSRPKRPRSPRRRHAPARGRCHRDRPAGGRRGDQIIDDRVNEVIDTLDGLDTTKDIKKPSHI